MTYKDGSRDITIDDCLTFYKYMDIAVIITDGKDVMFQIDKKIDKKRAYRGGKHKI